jgi:hypothetical protein
MKFGQPAMSVVQCTYNRAEMLQAVGSGYQRTALKHASISLREAPFSPGSWLALRISVLPRHLRHLLKNILVTAGLWRAAR